MDKEKFGKFVATVRKEKGLTQKELAQILNLSDKAVSKWERGLSFPDISVLEPLAEIMEVSVLEMLRGERIKEERTLSVMEAEEVLDQSISISGAEINRNHVKNKFIIIICCILLMLLISVVINIINYSKADTGAVISRDNSAYQTMVDNKGEMVFQEPDMALQQMIRDLQKHAKTYEMTWYLEMLKKSYKKQGAN